MPPLPEEYEGNSPAEELARANAGGEETPPSTDSPQAPSGTSLPGGLSDDAAANKRTTKAKKDAGVNFANNPIPSPTSGNFAQRLAGRVSKSRRAKIIGGAVGGSLLIAVVGFIAALPYELIHLEENITHAFDKRLEHSIQNRLASHYREVFDEGGHKQGDVNTGDPIKDASHNYSLDEFATDADISGKEYGSTGEVVAFTDSGGERLAVNNSTLENESSPLMEHLNSRFPPLDFFRLSVRSRILDSTWGIKRSFLSTKDESVSEDSGVLDKKVSEDFVAAEENTNGAPNAQSENEDNAKEDLNESTNDAQTESTLSVGPAKTALTLCGAVGISESIHRNLWLLRVAQLMRISNSIMLDSGHQLKTGNLHASQLQSLMKLLAGFGKSGGWQVISHTKGAGVSNIEKSKFAANPSGGLANVTGEVDKAGTVCDPVNTAIKKTPFGLGPFIAAGGLDLAEGILGPEEVGLVGGLETVAISVAQNFAIGEALNYLAGIATNAANKPIIDTTKAVAGSDVVDATISGYDNYSNFNAMSNGGERLTAAQVGDLDQAADTQEVNTAEQKGIAYQLLSPDYSHSLTSILMQRAPVAPSQVASGMNTMIAMVSSPFSPKLLHSFGSFLVSTSPVASADNTATDAEDPSGWGVPQMGLPDSLLNKYPDPEANEQVVLHYLCSQPGESGDQPGLYDGACSGGGSTPSSSELTEQNDKHHDPYHDFVNKCLTSSDPDSYLNDSECQSDTHGTGSNPDIYDRFRVYRLDLGVSNMMTSYNNTDDDQNPNGGGDNGSTPPPTTISGASCTTLQACAQMIKQLASQHKVTYAVDASAIEANINLEADGHDPKFNGNQENITTASPFILAAVVALGQQGTVQLNSYIDGESHVSPTNPHHLGQAMDIGAYEGHTLGSGDISETKKVEQIVGQVLPAQSRFGADFYSDPNWSSPITVDGKQFLTGNDAPAHLHMDVVGVSGN